MKTHDIETTKKLFAQGHSEKTILKPLDKYTMQCSRHVRPAENYMVYSYDALPELLKKISELDPNEHKRYQARYVMQDNGTLWFAVEALPGQRLEFESKKNTAREQSPAHSEMLPPHAKAIAAGIVVFSEDRQRIEGISNFSGHYRPYVTTVVWPLAALIQFNAVFADNVSLILFWKNKGLKSKTITLSKEQLPNLLPSDLSFVADSTYAIAVRSEGIWNNTPPSSSLNDDSTFNNRKHSGSVDRIVSSPKRKLSFFSSSDSPLVNDPFSDWDGCDDNNEDDVDYAVNGKSSGLA